MLNILSHTKFVTFSSAALLAVALGASTTASAGSVLYADPVPYNAANPDCNGGLSYEWTVKLAKKDKASFIGHVGAKSYNEPPPAYEPPDTGWTHTSNWVALELTHKSKVRIEVERQEGVAFTSAGAIATARNMLVPALSVYSGWDNTSCEEHRYNTAGNVDWTTVQFVGNQPNAKGKIVAVYEGRLSAGQYSIAIGGSPAVLPTYPAGTCDALDPTCYAYTGRHGYRATIKTDD